MTITTVEDVCNAAALKRPGSLMRGNDMTQEDLQISAPVAVDAQEEQIPVANRRSQLLAQASFGAVGALAIIVTSEALAHFYPDEALWIFRIATAVSVGVLCALIALHHRRQWIGPLVRLESLVDNLRLGIVPIDELNTINGGLAPLAGKIKLVMQELRKQHQQLNELHEEMRQRVAGRTSALERTIHALRKQATRDPLSGLYNRRMLDELLPKLIQNCVERKIKLALLMMDVDYFKDLNDTLGHASGDNMLRSLGQLIHSSIREGDFAFRVGGDEFIILLPGCDGANALIKSDRLKSLVAGLTSTMKLARKPQLSIGISNLCDLREITPENLMRKADEDLYAAKASRKKVAGAR